MEDFDFTEDEIREQLGNLGIYDVPAAKLKSFKTDLDDLVRSERSKDSTSSYINDTTAESTASHLSPHNHSDVLVNEHPKLYYRKLETRHPDQPTKTHRPYTFPYHARADDDIAFYPGMKEQTELDENMYRDEEVYPNFAPRVRDALLDREKQRLLELRGIKKHTADVDSSQLDSSGASDKKMIKRRVARKVDGHIEVYDEMTESEMGDLATFEMRMRELDLERPAYQHPRSKSAPPEAQPTRPGVHGGKSKPPKLKLSTDYTHPPSFIRTPRVRPGTIKKNSFSDLYQYYDNLWRNQKKRHDNNFRHLHSDIKEVTVARPIIQKRAKPILKRNDYVPPTDKHHTALRWQVREDLANFRMPSKEY